jgi:predicted NBD/HSP70 family sugar kinase
MDGSRPLTTRSDQGPGRVLAAIMNGEASTRTGIEQLTGLSRPTVANRLQLLSDAGLIRESSKRLSSGGRPANVIELDERAALCLCIDIGEERTRVAVADLRAKILVEQLVEIKVDDGPAIVLTRIEEVARQLLAHDELAGLRLGGIGVGLPAPVDFATGRSVGWSVMAGWDGYGVRDHLMNSFSVPVFVDNDVNLLLLAEQRLHWPDEGYLLYVKAGTGIGSGLVIDGKINRGALGAAGDIGHAHISGYGDPLCRCGNRSCLEALVGGWALARDLRESSGSTNSIHDARDVVRLIQRGDSDAVARVRDAGRILGEAVAFATSILNPAVIVIGGMLAEAGDQLMAGVREVVYQRSLPLATRSLNIVLSQLHEDAGIVGAALLVSDSLMAADRIDSLLLSAQR